MNARDKLLDVSVAVLMLLWIFWAAGMCVYINLSPANINNAAIALKSCDPFLKGLAFITCLVLALWLIRGQGVKSLLWNWLPPFVCFRKFGKNFRIILVGLLIFSTLFGILGDILGF